MQMSYVRFPLLRSLQESVEVQVPVQDVVTSRFYDKELLAPLLTPKLEDHPLQTLWECLFGIYAAAPIPKASVCRCHQSAGANS
jgi:hypothetical protein